MVNLRGNRLELVPRGDSPWAGLLEYFDVSTSRGLCGPVLRGGPRILLRNHPPFGQTGRLRTLQESPEAPQEVQQHHFGDAKWSPKGSQHNKKTGRDETTRQDETRRDTTRQDKTRQDWTKENKTRQKDTRQDRTQDTRQQTQPATQ